MRWITLLLFNSLFLLVVLVVLISLPNNKNSVPSRPAVHDDLKKIKEQINKAEN